MIVEQLQPGTFFWTWGEHSFGMCLWNVPMPGPGGPTHWRRVGFIECGTSAVRHLRYSSGVMLRSSL